MENKESHHEPKTTVKSKTLECTLDTSSQFLIKFDYHFSIFGCTEFWRKTESYKAGKLRT